MHMTFWWNNTIEEFLFDGVKTSGAGGLTLLCLVLLLLCVLYEAIKLHQARVRLSTIRERFKLASCQPPNESATLLSASELAQQRLNASLAQPSTSATIPTPRVIFMDPTNRLVQLFKEAIIFFIQAVLGYFLMLSVMTYNGPVFISILLGMGLGYFLFGHFTMGLNWESMKMNHTTFKCSKNCPNGESQTNGHPCSIDENQNIPANISNGNASVAMQKLQSVADSIIEKTIAEHNHSCCKA